MALYMLIAVSLLCAGAYYICPRRLRWLLLLAASYGFYAVSGARALAFSLLPPLSTWAGALLIGRTGERSRAALKSGKGNLALEEIPRGIARVAAHVRALAQAKIRSVRAGAPGDIDVRAGERDVRTAVRDIARTLWSEAQTRGADTRDTFAMLAVFACPVSYTHLTLPTILRV